MKRAALYARYSTDQSNDRSIEDQLTTCREYAARNGYTIVATFEDRAASGASIHGRPGMQSLLRLAPARTFDFVLVELLSRVGRDQADRHAIRRDLKFHDVDLVTPTDGVVTPMVDGLRAIIDSQYLDDLKIMVRRGMAGVVRDGRHAGGRAYGYRPIPGQLGELEIVEAEAAIVRRIFADYVAGKVPREIAADLNRERVPAPRGPRWSAITVNGNAGRGTGMLLNELYAGRIVWNKVRMVKDPATGKRVSRPNKPDQFKIAEAPHLAIVDAATWQAAQARKAERSVAGRGGPRLAPRLLSGLVKCGACGAGMVSIGKHRGRVRLQCSARRESGACSNGARPYIDEIERTAVLGLRRRLAERGYFEAWLAEYNAERRRLARSNGAERGRLERRAGEIARELARAVDLLIRGTASPATLAAPIAALEAERDAVAAKLRQADQPGAGVVALHPASLARFLADLDALAAQLDRDSLGAVLAGENAAAVERFRRLVTAVRAGIPGARPGEVEIVGRLDELLRLPAGKAIVGGCSLVAEGRFIRSPPHPFALRCRQEAA